MRKAIWTIFVLTISVNCLGQLTTKELPKETVIGKAKSAFTKVMELKYIIEDDGDTLYTLSYIDKSYQTMAVWDFIYFSGGQKVLNSLYETLKAAIDADKKSQKAITLGKTDILIRTERSLGIKYIILAVTKESGATGITDLTIEQLDSLFGRQ